MKFKTLTKQDEAELVRAFHYKWKDAGNKNYAQLWYSVIGEFINWKFEGAEIVPRSVRDAEVKILQSPVHCKEYFSALYNVLNLSSLEPLTEEQKFLYMMMASGDEREQAIQLIQC
jgi:hypothetical protein